MSYTATVRSLNPTKSKLLCNNLIHLRFHSYIMGIFTAYETAKVVMVMQLIIITTRFEDCPVKRYNYNNAVQLCFVLITVL